MTKKKIKQEEREAGIRAMMITLQELSFNQDTIAQSQVFHAKLEEVGMTQSMSRVAHCIGNGPMESI